MLVVFNDRIHTNINANVCSISSSCKLMDDKFREQRGASGQEQPKKWIAGFLAVSYLADDLALGQV